MGQEKGKGANPVITASANCVGVGVWEGDSVV